jgi:hypothetical protein
MSLSRLNMSFPHEETALIPPTSCVSLSTHLSWLSLRHSMTENVRAVMDGAGAPSRWLGRRHRGAKRSCRDAAQALSETAACVTHFAGFEGVGVFRLADGKIGCSLAEAAESDVYTAYLSEAAARQGPNLHVIYINTSLRTKVNPNRIISHVLLLLLHCRSILRAEVHLYQLTPGKRVNSGG